MRMIMTINWETISNENDYNYKLIINLKWKWISIENDNDTQLRTRIIINWELKSIDNDYYMII